MNANYPFPESRRIVPVARAILSRNQDFTRILRLLAGRTENGETLRWGTIPQPIQECSESFRRSETSFVVTLTRNSNITKSVRAISFMHPPLHITRVSFLILPL
jgi:hypothetical protein